MSCSKWIYHSEVRSELMMFAVAALGSACQSALFNLLLVFAVASVCFSVCLRLLWRPFAFAVAVASVYGHFSLR